MDTLKQWWGEFWEGVRHSPTILPTRYAILPGHVDKPTKPAFKRDEHYFSINMNRIFLKYDREFWTTYAPMALVVSEFLYNGETIVVPVVIGPSVLEKDKVELPSGFVFQDARVAGIHPYKGGGLKLTVILYRVKRTDLARKLLKVIDKVSSVLDFSQVLGSYLKIANVMIDTVADIIGDSPENQPLIGLQQTFGPGEDFKPGYFVLIDTKQFEPEQTSLWVEENELLYGDANSKKKFTAANHVLYSISQDGDRDDYDKLAPVGEMWKQVKTEATRTKAETWENAKVAMSTLYSALVISPDLTEDHANRLNDDLLARMIRMHERALGNVQHGAAPEADALEKTRRKALDILKL